MKRPSRNFLHRLGDGLAAMGNGAKRSYAAAEMNRVTADWLGVSDYGPDDEVRWSMSKIRRRARDLEQNNATIRNYLRILSVNVIGPKGIELEARNRLGVDGDLDRPTNDRIEAGWDEWGESVTIDGRWSMPSFSRNVMRSIARDGEAFVRLWRGYPHNRFGIALESIDPVQVDDTYNVRRGDNQNEVRMGVEVDGFGRPTAYFVFDQPISLTGAGLSRRRVRIPADEIIHLYDPDRINQARGVSWLASVMVPAKMLDGYIEAELIASRVGASKMLFFQRKDTTMGVSSLGEETSLDVDVAPGSSLVLPDGYEVADWNPSHPNTAFGDFVKNAMRNIATGLGVSYNALASDLEGVNYSSMRSGLLIERDVWRCVQQWWIGAFLRIVYREWLNSALLSGALELSSMDYRKYLTVKWSPRGWSWVDPLKDTQAGVLGIQNGLASRQDLLSEQGKDVEDVLEQLAEEKKWADQYGVSIVAPDTTPPDVVGDDAGDGAATAKNGKGRAALTNGHRVASRF